MVSAFRTRAFDPTLDAELGRALFACTVAADLALLPEPLRSMLLDQQHAAWSAALPRHGELEDRVILDDSSVSVGRLILARTGDELRVVEIGLFPEHRGRGLGGAVLADVFATARAEGRVVRGTVRRDNPARRLYARLGMQVEAEHDLDVALIVPL